MMNCNKEHPFGRFVGKCSETQSNYDDCMKQEFEKKRKAALAKARAHDQDFAKHAADVVERASKQGQQQEQPPKQ